MSQLNNVLEENDLDVTLLDKPVSTPMLSYLTLTKFWLGIMVTANHNGPEYNGIKLLAIPDLTNGDINS